MVVQLKGFPGAISTLLLRFITWSSRLLFDQVRANQEKKVRVDMVRTPFHLQCVSFIGFHTTTSKKKVTRGILSLSRKNVGELLTRQFRWSDIRRESEKKKARMEE